MGFSLKQLKSILEKYGYDFRNAYYEGKYFNYVECVMLEHNIPVLIYLDEKLKFYSENEENCYRFKKIDKRDLYLIDYNIYESKNEINTQNLEDFEEELLKKYKKNNKIKTDLEDKGGKLLDLYNQRKRLSELVKKFNYKVILLENTYMIDDKYIFEIKNFRESERKMLISFKLESIYDDNSSLKKNIANVYQTICEILFDNFRSQIKATEELISNYQIDYKAIENLLQTKNVFDEKIKKLTKAYNDKKQSSEKIQNSMDDLEKNSKNISEFQLFRLRDKYTNDLRNIVGDMEKMGNEIIFLKEREKQMFLRFEEIFFENIRCLQTIRKNLMELNKF